MLAPGSRSSAGAEQGMGEQGMGRGSERQGRGLGECSATAGFDEVDFPSLLQSALSRLLAERGLHVAEIREAAHGAGEQTGWG